jgi:predicted anti-sigma-YlaC factor YlaD
MNCLECQELLQKRLDGDRSAGPEALDRHLSECAVCRELHAGAACLLEGLKRMPQPKLAPGFAQTLAAQVIRDRRQRREKMRRRVFLTVALAASVLLTLLLAYQWMPRTVPQQKQDIAKEQREKQLPPKVEPEVKHAGKHEPRTTLTALTERWADTTRDHAQVVLVGTNLDGVDKLPAVNELPMIDPSVREAGQEVSDGVRTVTRNARKAFDFFARELPMPDVGEQKN